ncbi:MAG: hypothetical protein ACK4RM_11180 [Flavobacterium sp.]
MKSFCFSIISVCFFIVCCSTWKSQLVKYGDDEIAITNAINDYLNTSRINKDFNVYHIIKWSQDDVLGISINGDNVKWQLGNVNVGDKRKYFPSRFKEFNGKLFYWSDSTQVVSNEMIEIMKNYNILDTFKYPKGVIPDGIGESSEGGVHYYFCKSNLLKYKKVKSKIAIGYYEPPKLNCYR